MRHRGVLVPALVFALLLPQAALAWNATGHELVAGIAWDNMTPQARQKAIAILKAASKDTCLPDLFPKDSRKLAVRQREFFMRAATWPDIIRDGACKSLSQPSWHFKDRFWEGISDATGSDAPKDRTDIPTPAVNAVSQLILFRHTVACDAGPCGPADERAMQLAWTLHLAGDIHQPLHTASRASSANPTGDVGGNLFKLGTGLHPPSLHGYWDGIVNNSVPLKNGETSATSISYLDRVEGIIVKAHPRTELAGRLESGDFDAWSQEGFETAKKSIYPVTLKEEQTPSETYRKMAFVTAEEAIALGGYRLADVLEIMMAAQPQAHAEAKAVSPKKVLPVPSHIGGNVSGPILTAEAQRAQR